MERFRIAINIVTGIVVGLAVFFITYLIMKPTRLENRMNSFDIRLSTMEGKFDFFTDLQKNVNELEKTVTHVQKELTSVKSPQIEEKELPLYQAPDTWGRTILGASGNVIYYDNVRGAFSGRITLRGLESNENYLLALNGKPSHPSNDRLPQQYGPEGLADIDQVRTDSQGNVSNKPFYINLPPGNYDVKFFVKDTTENWKIVLYNNFLKFTVN